VGRQNLNFRMRMRRSAGLTNGFSKKVEPHPWMVCLYTVLRDHVRMPKTRRCTPGDGGWYD
jgi:hypothetical protein